jgi:hypothetical protein
VSASDAPTTELGALGGDVWSHWQGVWDPTEHVPALAWPTSTLTYAKMRRDPVLASVLAAYVTPIVEARWAIDPRGASAKMTKLCADSLGLPILGKDDKPGPVRRRGVQWLTYLRLAVAGKLTWGHMPFEPVYEIRDGAAVLASLDERLPPSITEIEVDDVGRLSGIWQNVSAKNPRGAHIPADRLLWHDYQREGAMWQGNSLLRPAYAPWLIKQDILRVTATSHRRWGAGVPVAKPRPGTQPTEAQMRSAQAMASAARAGETAGAVAPPDFDLAILGIQGTMPDGPAFLRYLDEQMGRMALSSVLDLGSTSNGSRALGSVFADLLTGAVRSLARETAELSTQLCVRLVDFNAGEDALVPAVVAADVGTSRQQIAQVITDMISKGAITADEDLEAWIRQAFDLPKMVEKAPALPGPPVPPNPADPTDPPDPAAGDPTADPTTDPAGTPPPAKAPAKTAKAPAPVKASAAPRRPASIALAHGRARLATARPHAVRAAAAAPAPRELTPEEEAAGVDPQAQNDAQAAVLAVLLAAWLAIRDDQETSLIAQIRAATTLTDLTTLTIDTQDAADVLGAAMLEAADHGTQLALLEAAHQDVDITPAVVDVDVVQARADALAAVMGQGTATAAVREAVRLAGDGADMAVVAAGVEEFLAQQTGAGGAGVDTQLAGAVHTGISLGRAAVLSRAPTTAVFFASEILDTATCRQKPGDPIPRCWEIDGHQYPTWEAAVGDYPTGQYWACLGRQRCRGLIFASYMGPATDPTAGA